jgi:hypothetical protein
MPKIPAPKKVGDCIGFAGLSVCPHTVYLTAGQRKAVHTMHRRNVATLKKLKSVAKAKSRAGSGKRQKKRKAAA